MKTSLLATGLAVITSVAIFSYGKMTETSALDHLSSPETVTVRPGALKYRQSGAFLKGSSPTTAPIREVRFSRPLAVTKYQISRADYARCVMDDFCAMTFQQSDKQSGVGDQRPLTGVSYINAVNYARWLTQKTGSTWRLPTDAEWAYAAGSRFFDDAIGIETDQNDPSRQMLSKYKQAIELDREADPIVRPRGGFGANENGLYDMSGNVWEWTSTCYTRSQVPLAGQANSKDGENCGVRVVEGRHRAYVTYFIQDAKSGGCSVGTPPDYLGFRLVKDNPPLFSMKRIRNWLNAIL